MRGDTMGTDSFVSDDRMIGKLVIGTWGPEVCNSQMVYSPEKLFDQSIEGLKAAKMRLRKLIGTTQGEKIFAPLAECLLWVYIINDQVFWRNMGTSYQGCRDDDAAGKMIPGMRHAFNMVKHGIDVTVTDLVQTSYLGGFGTARFNRTMFNGATIGNIRWGKFARLPKSKQNPRRKEETSYRNYLEGRPVLDTLEEVSEFYLRASRSDGDSHL